MGISRYDTGRKGRYTIGQIAKLYHIGADAIRYYERKGILEPIRGENGYRYYSDQSIWRMNVIRELRELGFSVDQIAAYFKDRTPDTTERLLRQELEVICHKLEQLQQLRRSVEGQLDTLERAKALEPDRVVRGVLPPRRAFAIYHDHSRDEETDLLMRRLADRSGGHVQVAGNRKMAAIIAPPQARELFRGAMVFHPQGDVQVPGGEYLSLCYRGATDSRRRLQQLQDYARQRGLELEEPFLEIIWLDIHTASDPETFISQVQAKIKG